MSTCIARYRGLSHLSPSLSACLSAAPVEVYTEFFQLIRLWVSLWQTILLQTRLMRGVIAPSKSEEETFVSGPICPQQGAISCKTRSTTAATSARTSTVDSGNFCLYVNTWPVNLLSGELPGASTLGNLCAGTSPLWVLGYCRWDR